MRSALALLALLALPLAACDSTTTTAPKACSLNATAPAFGTSLVYTYTVSRAGTGTVTGISYRNAAPAAGNTGITDIKTGITLPWTVQVDLPAGTAPLLSATGSVQEGTLTAKIEGRAAGATTVTVNASDACSQSTK